MSAVLPAFSGYGIELEYMIVDRQSLSVLPIADELLRKHAGTYAPEARHGGLGWSNELVLHLLELKNIEPNPDIESLPAAFQQEIQQINHLLESMDARLMPTGMHPWMNPSVESQLWPHDYAEIYRAYDRIFDSKKHGWANLQSMHLNLPFADADEFARLHAAVRLILPILPALAASSPIAEGRSSGYLDFRMKHYCEHQMSVPSTTGMVIPETATSAAGYETQVLMPMYREIAALDPEGILQHEWLNARGAIPRFDRSAIEIRVIDTQECLQADFAIARAAINLVRTLYDETHAPLAEQQAIDTDVLVKIMHACIREAEHAVIADAEYLRLMGFPIRRCEARELWQHLIAPMMPNKAEQTQTWQGMLHAIVERGPLARRILNAVGQECSKTRLEAVYRELCDCLAEGRMFMGIS